MKKYVLCIPSGGFTDTLTQIQRSWHYCRAHNRTLVVDTMCSSCMRAQFSTYLNVVGDVEVIGEITKELVEHLNEHGQDVYAVTEASFDHNQKFDEYCLVERTRGGMWWFSQQQIQAFGAFADNLRIDPLVSKYIQQQLCKLPSVYDAIHVRNTDYQTDYRSFFNKVLPQLKTDHVLVCSDDYDCLQYAKEFFPQTILQVINLTPNPDKPRHKMMNVDYHKRNLDLLCDLFAMAKSQSFFYTQCHNNKWNKGFAGFSMLTKCLHDNPNITSKILQG